MCLPGQDGSDPVTKVAMYGCLSAPSMSSRLPGLKSMSLSTMSTASGGASFMSSAMSFLATWLGLGLALGLGLGLGLGDGARVEGGEAHRRHAENVRLRGDN